MRARRTLFLLAALGALACATAPEPRYGPPPNIVFIMVDDLGSADLGVTGSRLIRTPYLDRMAAEGMRFTQFYSGAPVCAPARSTLMTGRHAGHTPVRGNTGGVPLPAEALTVADYLKQAGYATGGFGKWGLGEVGTAGVPEHHGFDVFFGYYHQIHAHRYYPEYLYRNSQRVPLPGNAGYYDDQPEQGPVAAVDPATGQGRSYAQTVIFEETLDFIRANQDGRFFCYAAWTPPHGRFEIPEDDPAWKLYADEDWPVQARVIAAMTTMIDRQVGELLALLEELGLAENTVVFFCSDNGGYTAVEGPLKRNGDLRGQKGSLYEGGLRVPFLAWWPGRIAAGSTSDFAGYFPDLLPTLVDLAGTGDVLAPEWDGRSLAPILLDRGGQGRHPYLYWEYTPYEWNAGRYRPEGPMQAIRSGNWKALRAAPGAPIELYNLRSDPGEQGDVAASNPQVVAKMESWFSTAREEPPFQNEPERIGGKPYR